EPSVTPLVGPSHPSLRAADSLHAARERERAGCIPEAIERYESAIAAAQRAGEHALWAEALRRLAVLRHHRSEPARARELCRRSYDAARQIGDDVLAAEALNTLGGLDVTAGSLEDARKTFVRALELGGSSRRLRARVQQNLGIVANIQGELSEALARYERSLAAYRECGDEHGCAIAYHNLGMVSADRERFDAAGSVLNEAEASRELALLYQAMGRNQDALRLLNVAYRLFRRLDARVDLVHVGGKVAELEGTYLAVVREWGQSIESSDGYTFGHCERVARHAVAVARALGLDEQAETTVLLGAYLHDVGKVRIPHEILHKPGSLTAEERAVVQMHPVWGI